MNDSEILENLNTLSEDEMIEKVILPLYIKRFRGNFFEIEFSGKDKREDEGIDIQYYEISTDTNAKEYSGVQVKQGDINTSKGANGIAAISIQAEQAFQKRIGNTKEKSEYRISSYIILTTGEIKPKARVHIVDQFKGKNIKFIDGALLVEWIRKYYLDEFNELFGSDDMYDEDDDDGDFSPLEIIVEFLEENYKTDIREIKASLDTLGRTETRIVKTLLLDSPLKKFALAKALGRNLNSLDDELRSLMDEDVIDGDEQGYYINESQVGEWGKLREAAEVRIGDLGYEDEVTIEEIINKLFV